MRDSEFGEFRVSGLQIVDWPSLLEPFVSPQPTTTAIDHNAKKARLSDQLRDGRREPLPLGPALRNQLPLPLNTRSVRGNLACRRRTSRKLSSLGRRERDHDPSYGHPRGTGYLGSDVDGGLCC